MASPRTPQSSDLRSNASSLEQGAANGEPASELGRAARLLEDAKRSLERAGEEATRRNQELACRIQELEGSLSEMERLLVQTEGQAAQLANLYVATYQLHASLEVADVRAAIADIAVNLLGAERFTILLKHESGQFLAAPESSGRPDTDHLEQAYAGGDALVDACIKEGSPQFGPHPSSELLVAVPFVRQGEVVGLLAVRAFLGHKPGLSADDHELLDLMAAHAASALVAARAFHVSQRKLSAYEGLLGFMRGGAS